MMEMRNEDGYVYDHCSLFTVGDAISMLVMRLSRVENVQKLENVLIKCRI